MSRENFLSFLQQILTMVDPNNEESVRQGRAALDAVCSLAQMSGMADWMTMQLMRQAQMSFDMLVLHRADFAGQPGHLAGNSSKRKRLMNVLQPSC